MGQIMVIPSWLVPDLWPLTLLGAAFLALLLAGRAWRVALPGDPSAPQSRRQAALRRLNRAQLRRPALVPTLLTFGALAVAVGVRMAIPTPSVRDATLSGLVGTYSVGILTVRALLAGIVTGFTFVTIGTLGETFTPLLADPAIRAHWLWRFLGCSLAWHGHRALRGPLPAQGVAGVDRADGVFHPRRARARRPPALRGGGLQPGRPLAPPG